MKDTIINVKSNKSLKKSAENYARELGVSLSDLVNLALRYVVMTRSVVLDVRPEPSKETQRVIKEALQDMKAHKNVSPRFKSVNDAFLWLSKQSDSD